MSARAECDIPSRAKECQLHVTAPLIRISAYRLLSLRLSSQFFSRIRTEQIREPGEARRPAPLIHVKPLPSVPNRLKVTLEGNA